MSYLDESLLRSLVVTLRNTFEHVEIYQPQAATGILLIASAAPITSFEEIERALAGAPDDFARFGFHDIGDVVLARVVDDEGTRALALGATPISDDHNLLAARASRLGDQALDIESVRALFRDLDPLRQDTGSLDRSALVRALWRGGFRSRATDVALAAEGAEQECELGWLGLLEGRSTRARRHFERALSLEPEFDDANLGLIAMGVRLPDDVGGVASSPAVEALIEARTHRASGDWDAVLALDEPLSTFGAGHAFFPEASRLRIDARLARGDAGAGAEAQQLVEAVLVRGWTPEGALLRARSALLAGQPEAAWGAVVRIVRFLERHPQRPDLRVRTLEFVRALPADLSGDLETRLEALPR